MKAPPIIFMHYGDSPYLRTTLRTAVRFNPGRQVILIGDEENAKYGMRCGVHHRRLCDYDTGQRIDRFRSVFQYLVGEDFERKTTRGHRWVHFNLLKWFILEHFLAKQRIAQFWTFDSDTLLVDDLSRVTDQYSSVDYTVMNENNQLQGLVNNVSHLAAFCDKVIDIFRRDGELARRRDEYQTTRRGHAFTMMAFWGIYQAEERPSTVKLGSVADGWAFDECVSLPCELSGSALAVGRRARGEYECVVLRDKPMKRLYTDGEGRIFGRVVESGEFIQFWGLNMSWQPDWVIEKLARVTSRRLCKSPLVPRDAVQENLLQPIDLANAPLRVRFRSLGKTARYWALRYPVLVYRDKILRQRGPRN